MDFFPLIANDSSDGRLGAIPQVVATKIGHRFLQESTWEFINMFLENSVVNIWLAWKKSTQKAVWTESSILSVYYTLHFWDHKSWQPW